MKKKPIKPIKILKKLANSVRFWFYKPEINKKRTESKPEKKPSQTGKKPSQTGKNQAKLVWTDFFPKKPNRTETGRFEPVSVFLKKNKFQFGYLFL